MKVLVACEESQVVTEAFINAGHDAMSCDLQPGAKGLPHYQGDVRDILYKDWDLVIAFPPCTDLAVSGARWFPEKVANGSQAASIEFFLMFTKLTCKWVIENPIGIMSTRYRKPDQIIQPWQFGHGETKATCLWVNNMPLLEPTDIVKGREGKVWRMAPGPDRAKLRSRTYEGIAKAMSQQYSLKLHSICPPLK